MGLHSLLTERVQIMHSIAPLARTTTAVAGTAADTSGYAYATVVFHTGASGSGTSVMNVTESATSGGTYTDITGGTSSLVDDAASDNSIVMININLKNAARLRFIKAAIDNGATSATSGALIYLSRGRKHEPTQNSGNAGTAATVNVA